MRSFAFLTVVGILTMGSAYAQEVQKYEIDVGGGFDRSLGASAYDLDNGWNVEGGVGYNFDRALGARVDLGYNGLGITGTELSNIGVPSGEMHIFSATLDPVFHLMPFHHFDFYAIGGGGVYHVSDDFSSGAVNVPGASPFFGYYPGASGVFTNYVVNRPGFDVGAGFAFGQSLHGRFFAEAKWNHVFLSNNYHIDYLPVTFGFRW